MTQHSNQKSKTPKGKPSGNQRAGNGLNDINLNDADDQAIGDKFLHDQGQPAERVKRTHKNRNTDKGREDQGKKPI